MAMITPASDAFPSMIPPSDFPSDFSPDVLSEGDSKGDSGDVAENALPQDSPEEEKRLVFVESRELHVLAAFLAAFSRYMADRHNPDASFEVLARYRAALRFYDADAGEAFSSGSSAGRAHSSSGVLFPPGNRSSSGGPSASGDRAAVGLAGSSSGGGQANNRAKGSLGGRPKKKRPVGRPSGSRPAGGRAKNRAATASGGHRLPSS